MVTVIGLGFVGLTTALGFAEYGHKVYGIDADPERLRLIQEGKIPFLEPDMEEVLKKHLGKHFIPTDNWQEAVAESECVYYCVGTPYGKNGEADLTCLYKAISQTLSVIHDDRFRVLVTKSTIPPTTSQNRIIPFLKQNGISVPEQMGVANNPEFLREGHCWEDFIHTDRIVLGVSDSHSEDILRELYSNAKAPVCAVSLNTGEYIKYLSNASLACMISFANEMSRIADAFGDIDVANAFHILHMDKRWQTGSIRSYMYPGCGYGGYCLPKDTNALYQASRAAGFDPKILGDVMETNDEMAQVAANKIMRAAGEDKDTCIGILGLSFNAGSGDTRDTPSARIIQALNDAGFTNLVAYDPVAIDEFRRYYTVQCEYLSSMSQVIQKADVLAIATAWPEFCDIRKFTEKLVIDCRYML